MVRIPAPVDEAVVVGIPGDLLLRRPDVLATEDQLRIQSAQIGIAEAEMLPHIGINGTIGLAANHFGRCSTRIVDRQHRPVADVEHPELRPAPGQRSSPKFLSAVLIRYQQRS